MESKTSFTELEEMIHKGSDDINDYFALGVLYLENGNFEKLLSLYDDAARLQLTNLDHTRILHEKGKALQMLNKEQDAAALFHKSLRLLRSEKDSVDSLDLKALNLYNLFLHSQSSDEDRNYAFEASECFKKLIKEYNIPEEGYSVYSHLADIYTKLGEYEDALNYYNKAIELSAEKSDIVWLTSGIADVYAMKGDYRQAAGYFNKALSKAGKNFPTSKIYFG
ncbi:MAG: tetratricopeptide repeat protein [Desulfobacteraceae bacterium]|nr:tetratricopeptide repeat protein [Desulfobacteraceae bacterium]